MRAITETCVTTAASHALLLLQLLCVVIVFTYAVISPIILPFGLIYFLGALTVYKKQILYVYSPVYESAVVQCSRSPSN